jgi:hypothetical protein
MTMKITHIARGFLLETPDEEYGQEVELHLAADNVEDGIDPELTIEDEAGDDISISAYLLPQLIEALTEFQKEVPLYSAKKLKK